MIIGVLALFSILLLSKNSHGLEPANAVPKTSYEQLVFDQQANKGPDLKYVRKLRAALNAETTLSKNAKNIQIIIVKKEIVIKGLVNSEAEKNKILSIININKTDHTIRAQLEISNDPDLVTP